MAVFQISRIQIRRGRANSGTGIPQLASGEMAWAIDTQELFIGNGAVSEGAPEVNNTKILTEHDLNATNNLLGIIQYIYKFGTSIDTGPTIRSLQDRLDDQPTVVDFGTVSDGITDDVTALQLAIDQLFLNVTPSSNDSADGVSTRVVLVMPAGVFKINTPLYVPSYTTIIGAGADKSIIEYSPITSTFSGSSFITASVISSVDAVQSMVGKTITGPGIPLSTTVVSVAGTEITMSNAATATATSTFTLTPSEAAVIFVNENSTASNRIALDNLPSKRPNNIQMSNLGIRTSTGVNTCLDLNAVTNSLFENINLRGADGFSVANNAFSRGVNMMSNDASTISEHNIFRNVNFYGFSVCVEAVYDSSNNIFEVCTFNNSRQAFALGAGSDGVTSGQINGPKRTQVVNCTFSDIKWHGVYIERGTLNTVTGCKFDDVGNHGGGDFNAVYPVVYFKTAGNIALNNQYDRTENLADTSAITPYVPEFSGRGQFNLASTRQVTLGTTAGMAFRLPAPANDVGSPTGSILYQLDYQFISIQNDYTRAGTIVISAYIGDGSSPKVQLSDEYNFAGIDTGTDLAVGLDFSAQFLDQDNAVYTGALGQIPYTIMVNYTNSLTSDQGYLNYTYKAVS